MTCPLPKILTSWYHHIGVRFQHMNSGTSDHSTCLVSSAGRNWTAVVQPCYPLPLRGPLMDLRLCRAHIVFHSYSHLLLYCRSSSTWYVNELCGSVPIKLYLKKTGGRPDFSYVCNLLNPALSLAHALLLLRLNWLFFWTPVVFIFWPRHSTLLLHYHMVFPGNSVVKNPPANTVDAGLIPELGRSPGGGNGNPLQYSCLGNPMDRRPWWATVHGVAESWTQLSD